eukprot:TRINITY_DN276_c0_g2_i2.p1 TRINITY_DN276_c0_g2~~TRINITY_DN276_c0_g2_i2.p1  ORF type:complete len:2599 (-),score=378.72 TRINITY_DN276_c0_g2_i2:48-6866(-)
MDSLQLLSSESDLEDIKAIYEQAKNSIMKSITSIEAEARNAFNHQHFVNVAEKMNLLIKFQRMLAAHVDKAPEVSIESLSNLIHDTTSDKLAGIKQTGRGFALLHSALAWLRDMQQHLELIFYEDPKPYDEACQDIAHRITDLVEKTDRGLNGVDQGRIATTAACATSIPGPSSLSCFSGSHSGSSDNAEKLANDPAQDLQPANASRPFDDLVDMFVQLSELDSLSAYFPKLPQFANAKNRLNRIVQRKCQEFAASLALDAEIVKQASLLSSMYVVLAALRASGLTEYMDKETFEQLRRSPTTLEKACYDRIQVIQQHVALNKFDVEAQFAQLHVLMQVDQQQGTDIKVDSYQSMLAALEEKVAMLGHTVIEGLQLTFAASLAEQKSRLPDNMKVLRELISASVLDAYFPQPRCAQILLAAIDKIETQIQLVKDVLNSNVQSSLDELESIKILEVCIEQLSVLAPTGEFCSSEAVLQAEIVRSVGLETSRLLSLDLQSISSKLNQFGKYVRRLQRLVRCLQMLADPVFHSGSPEPGQKKALCDLVARREEAEHALGQWFEWIEAKQTHLTQAIADGSSKIQQSIGTEFNLSLLNQTVLTLKEDLDSLLALKQLEDLAPQAAAIYDGAIYQLKQQQNTLGVEAEENIRNRKLAVAEHQITVLRVMSILHHHLPATDIAALSTELKAKREHITNDIPRLLQRKNYKLVVSTLGALDKSSSEYQESCDLIHEHFESLMASKRVPGRPRDLEALIKAVEQTHQLCSQLEQAAVLNDFDIPIAEYSAEFNSQLRRMLAECQKLYDSATRSRRYVVVCELCEMLSSLPAASELGKKLSEQWRGFLENLPKTFEGFLSQKSIAAINGVQEGLLELQKKSDLQAPEVVEAFEAVQMTWEKFVAQKTQEIDTSIGLHQPNKAKMAIHDLAMFKSVSLMTESTKNELDRYSHMVDKLEQSLRNVNIDDPVRMGRLLFDLSSSPSQLPELLQLTDKTQTEATRLMEDFKSLLSQVLTAKVVASLERALKILSTLAKPCPENIDNCSPVLQTFYSRIQKNLDSCRDELNFHIDGLYSQMELHKRNRKWDIVHSLLDQMESAKNGLGEFLSSQHAEKIGNAKKQLHTLADTIASSKQLFETVDFAVAVSPETLKDINGKLSQIKLDGGLVSTIEGESTNYEGALTIIENKIRDLHLFRLPIDWNHVVIAADNLNKIIDGLKSHARLTIAAEQMRRSLREIVTKEAEKLALEARTLLANKTFADLEHKMLDIKKIEEALQRVPEMLTEKHYHKLVAVLEQDISKQASDIKKAPRYEPNSLSKELVSLYSITHQLSCAQLHAHVHKEIADILNTASVRSLDLYQLSRELHERGALGRELVEDANYPQFRAFLTELMNKKTSRMTCTDALEYMKIDVNNTSVDTNELNVLYEQFESDFNGYLKVHLMSDQLNVLVDEIKANFGNIPKMLAGILALWSVLGSKSHFQQTKKLDCVMRPHANQVLALFRILGLDTKPGLFNVKTWVAMAGLASSPLSLSNHVVQVGTGEGKSVILGSLAALLALLGYDIYCACYSKYLSQRDYRSFQNLFTALGVTKSITYATLSGLADTIFNKEVDVRKATDSWLHGQPYCPTPTSHKREILLFDEVDVFFDKEFYGATYNPSTYIRDPCVNQLMEYIWKNRANRTALADVYKQKPYSDLCAKFGALKQIIRNCFDSMVADVASFAKPAYAVTTDDAGRKVIGYNEFGVLMTNITYGYKTAFAYLCEAEKGVVDKKTASDFLGLKINCGQFSYAELPHLFPEGILGVTGTLETLGSTEKTILQEVYNVSRQTIMPSIYGPSNLQFRKIGDTCVLDDKVRYHQKIMSEALEAYNAGRAVLIFFENEKKLKTFAATSYGKDLGDLAMNNFSENHDNLDFYIKRATRTKQVSILPAVYGRGVDFMCVDNLVENAGGIAVIMTYLPADLSDEVQIRGRTARQGNKGSFKVVLYAGSLVKHHGVDKAELSKKKESNDLYDFLNEVRVARFDANSRKRTEVIHRSKALHADTMKYVKSFEGSRATSARAERYRMAYLLSQNPKRKSRTRILCVFDATGSMSPIWSTAKVQITEMIARVNSIGGAGQVQFKLVAYRDYDCKGNEVEASGWEAEPARLHPFLNTIKCYGGGDGPEAVELGLKVANESPERTRVILIGDAEPHLEGVGNVVAFHKHTLATDYLAESQKLKASDVPVYSFYMNTGAALVKSFTEISEITGGKASLFKNADSLIDVISETTLHDLGGDDLVQEYRKTYHS